MPFPPFTVRENWVCQFQVMLEGALIVKLVEHDDPLDGTLPLPVQPVHTYRVPVPPLTGELTDADMEPTLNQLLDGLGEP
jgi:hypothetical protein